MKLIMIAVLVGAVAGLVGGICLALFFPEAPVETAGIIGAVVGACIGALGGRRSASRRP